MRRTKIDTLLALLTLGLAGLLLFAPKPAAETGPALPAPDAPPAETRQTGWWPLLKQVAADIGANGLMTQAAAITFYALLSLFPALAALVSIYGLVADPQTIVDQIGAMSMVLPGGGMDILSDQLHALTSSSTGGLGWGAAIGIATSLWTANQAMKAIFNALDVVWGAREHRGFVMTTVLTLGCTAGLILFVVLAIGAIVVLPAVFSFVGLGDVTRLLLGWLRWPILLLGIAVLLAFVYRFGPSRTDMVWRWITPGSAFAAVGWMIVSVLFSWYVGNFGSYNKTYGSLGAIIGFMTWVWLSATVVLIGAQVDADRARGDPTQA